MKTSTLKNYRHLFILATATMGLLMMVSGGWAQQYISQEGRMLDANTRIGSFGINTTTRLDSLMPRVNGMITGNVTGGVSFQGLVPYQSSGELQSTLGSSSLSNFRRDSVGAGNLSTGLVTPRPYTDYSRSVTYGQGSSIVQSGTIYQPRSTSLNGTYERSSYSNVQSNLRPLGSPYSSLNVSQPASGLATPGYGIGSTSGSLSNMAQSLTPDQLRELQQLRQEQEQNELQETGEQEAQSTLQNPAEQPFDQQQNNQAEDGRITNRDQLYTDPLKVNRANTQTGFEESFESTTANRDRRLEAARQAEEHASRNQRYSEEEGQEGEQTTAQTKPAASETSQSSRRDVSASDLQQYRQAIKESNRRNFDSQMSRGKDLFAQGQYYRAASAFGSAMLYEPDNARCHIAKAHALLGAEEYMSTAFYLAKALQLDADIVATKMEWASMLPNRAVLDKEIEDLIRWHERSGQPMLLFVKGYIEYRIGVLKQAETTLKKALEAQPKETSIKRLLEAVQAASPKS